MDLKKIRSTEGQRKILAIAGIVLLAFVVFIWLIYIPQRNRFENLKRELRAMEAEIAEIKKSAYVTDDESMVKSLDALLRKFKVLHARFPSKEEAILRDLPVYAERCGIEIKSMQPQKKRSVTDINGRAVSIPGYAIEEMQIAITAMGRYKAFGEYVRLLKEEFSAVIKISKVQMTQGPAGAERTLGITMGITAYLLVPSSEGA